MKNFKLKLKYEGKTIVDQDGNDISDFDSIMNGLKEKFDGKRRRE